MPWVGRCSEIVAYPFHTSYSLFFTIICHNVNKITSKTIIFHLLVNPGIVYKYFHLGFRFLDHQLFLKRPFYTLPVFVAPVRTYFIISILFLILNPASFMTKISAND